MDHCGGHSVVEEPRVDLRASYKSHVISPTRRTVGRESLNGLEFRDGKQDLSR
jgi:hypothetical protein